MLCHHARRKVMLGFILAGCWIFPAAGHAQALKADYQFQKTLASTVGKASALDKLGEITYATETVNGEPRTVLTFPEGSGVVLSPAKGVITDSYSIVVLFRLDSTVGYRRLVDFKNATTDMGLYTLEGALKFYNIAAGAEPVVHPNTFVQFMLTRDHQKNVCGYINGRLQFTFVDQGDAAVIGEANTLRFFRDDGHEHSSGAVARIRIYDAPLTVARALPPDHE